MLTYAHITVGYCVRDRQGRPPACLGPLCQDLLQQPHGWQDVDSRRHCRCSPACCFSLSILRLAYSCVCVLIPEDVGCFSHAHTSAYEQHTQRIRQHTSSIRSKWLLRMRLRKKPRHTSRIHMCPRHTHTQVSEYSCIYVLILVDT
jgi:hypothetical protein